MQVGGQVVCACVVCVCVGVWYVHMSPGAHGSLNHQISLKPELHGVVQHRKWVLGI